MANLIFKTQRGFQIDPSLTRPVDEPNRLANQLRLTHELKSYIDQINKCGGYILVTIEQDGKTIDNKLMNCNESTFDLVIDNLFST